jgi:hypothetical protein
MKTLDFFHKSMGNGLKPPDSDESLLVTQSEKPSNPLARYRNVEGHDPRKSTVRSFDEARPGSSFVVISPREYHEFEDSITVKTDVDLESVQGHFVIEYKLATGKFHENPNFLESLKTRWRPYGILRLDASGDFTIKSQRMLHIGKIN